jgi:hypothetical protein
MLLLPLNKQVGLASNQGCQMVCVLKPKYKFGKILEGLAMEDIGTYILGTLGPFYGLLLYLIDIWYTYFVVIWYIFHGLVFCNKKNMATLLPTDASQLLHAQML